MQDDQKTKVPADLLERFAQLHKELETKTGHRYSISFNQFGCWYDQQIGEFEKLGPWFVSEAKQGYEFLNGNYPTAEALKNRVTFRTHLREDGWECPDCNRLNQDLKHQVCKHCNSFFSERYLDYLSPDFKHGSVYISGGGSLSIATTVAKLVLL